MNPRATRAFTRADRSWEIRQDLFNFFAAQCRCMGARTESRKSGNRVSHELDSMRSLPLGRQYNSPVLNVRIQRIASTNVKPTTNRARKNDLPFSGDLGLHSKTVLPAEMRFGKRRG